MPSIYVRHEELGGGGKFVPAITVKPPPLFRRLPVKLQQAPQDVIDAAFEKVKDQWWEEVAPGIAYQKLHKAFKVTQVDMQPAGRSGGHLIVTNFPEPNDWTAPQVRAWFTFETAIKKSMIKAEKDFQREIRANYSPGK